MAGNDTERNDQLADAIDRLDDTMQRLLAVSTRRLAASERSDSLLRRLAGGAGDKAIDVTGDVARDYFRRRAITAAAGGGLMGKLAGSLAGRGIGAALGPLGAIAGGIIGGAAGGFLGSRGSRSSDTAVRELEVQTKLLTQMLVIQRTGGRSVRRQEVTSSFMRNPLVSTLSEEFGERQSAGTLSTAMQRRQAEERNRSMLRAEEARAAVTRSRATMLPDISSRFRDFRTEFTLARNAYQIGISGDVNTSDRVDSQVRSQVGRGLRAAGGQAFNINNLAGGPGGILGGMVGGFLGGSSGTPSISGPGQLVQPGILDGVSSALGSPRARNLARLQATGPGIIAGNSATVRAGTVGEYDFKVNQQRTNENRERTIQWQEEVLQTLREMLQRNETDPDAYFRTMLGFGRNLDREATD